MYLREVSLHLQDGRAAAGGDGPLPQSVRLSGQGGGVGRAGGWSGGGGGGGTGGRTRSSHHSPGPASSPGVGAEDGGPAW